MIRLKCLIVPALLLLSACGRDDNGEAAPDIADAPLIDIAGVASLYAHVPADTVALVGNLARVPDDIIDAWWSQIEAMTPLYAQMAQDEEQPAALRAYFQLIAKMTGRDEFEAMGMRADMLAVLYLDGLYPHLRMEVGDRASFESTLDEFTADADFQWRHGDIDGRPYRWLPPDEGKDNMPSLALSLNDDHFAVAWIPHDDARLRRLVGSAMPAQSITAAELERFNASHGYTAYGSGYLDLAGLLDRLLDPDDTDASAARAALDMEALADNPACRTEFSALIGHFPRAIFGIPTLRADHMTMHGRLETSALLGGQLAGIADVPLALGTDAGGVFNFGLGINLVNLRDAARAWVDGWVINPPECPAFSQVAESAEEWQVQLNQPIPPIVTNLQGVRAVLSELDFDNDQPDVRGVFSLMMNNPQLLVGMAAMFMPELAALDLRPDGQPQPVPPELFQGMLNTEAFIAMTDAGVALAIGDGERANLDQALRPGTSDGTLISYGVDMSAYADLFGRMLQQLPDEAYGDNPPPDMDSMLDAMRAFYERMFVAVRLTTDGIEFSSASDLKQ